MASPPPPFPLLPPLSRPFSLFSTLIPSPIIVTLFPFYPSSLTDLFLSLMMASHLLHNQPRHFSPLPVAEIQTPLGSRQGAKACLVFTSDGQFSSPCPLIWSTKLLSSFPTAWIWEFRCSTTTISNQVLISQILSLDLALNCFTIFPTTQIAANASMVRVYKYPMKLSVEISEATSSLEKQLCLTTMACSPTSVLDAVLSGESESYFCDDDSAPTMEMALHLTLAGKLLTSKKPSATNLTLLASRQWDCANRMTCFDHGKCLFSFEFTYTPDVETIMDGGPWFIGGDLLLVSRMNQNKSIEQMAFNSTKLWARCFDLPPKCFHLKFATAIGDGLGGFRGTGLPSEDPSVARLNVRRIPIVRKYLRVKFLCNLSKPLKRCQIIAMRNPVSNVVQKITTRLAYERLPPTCFKCGFIGHLVEGCSFSGPLLFGEWIRAENFFRFAAADYSLAVPGWTPPCRNSTVRERVGNSTPTQVKAAGELFEDPSIVQANYSDIRALGPLPVVISSKGKEPMIEQVPQAVSSLVPFITSSSKNGSPVGPAVEGGILGPIPNACSRPPLHSNPENSDIDEGQLASYFNPMVPHEDLFSPTNRCLFKNDMAHPAFSSNVRGSESSPILTSPLNQSNKQLSFTELLNHQSNHASVISFPPEEKKKATPSGRKRAVGFSSPRPKRGRTAANAVNIA